MNRAALQAALDAGAPSVVVPPGRFEGSLYIRQPTALVGAGRARSTLVASPGRPVLLLAPGARVAIAGLTLTGGTGRRGGAVGLSTGHLSVAECTIAENRAVFGGGLSVSGDGRLSVRDCEVRDNRARKGGGGIAVVDGAQAVLEQVVLANNAAEDGGHHLYAMSALDACAEIALDGVTLRPCAGRGTGIANVRGFEGRFELRGTPWPADSLKVPQRP